MRRFRKGAWDSRSAERLVKASLGAGDCFTTPPLSLLQSGHSTQWKRLGFILDPGLSGHHLRSDARVRSSQASFSSLQSSAM